MKSSFYLLHTVDKNVRAKILSRIEIKTGDKRLDYGRVEFWDGTAQEKFGVESFKAPLLGIRKNQDKFEKVIATFTHSGEEMVLIGIKNKRVVVNFNFFQWETSLLNEEFTSRNRPLYTKFPFPYYKIPVRLRSNLQRFLVELKKIGWKKSPAYPDWPIEPSLDMLRFIIWSNAAALCQQRLNDTPYPEDRNFCVIFTHDIETEEGLEQIESFRIMERKFGIKSSWEIVSRRYETPDSIIKGLIDEGCEVLSHGYSHDGITPYLNRDEIRKRINYIFVKKPWLKGIIRGYRGEQLLMSDLLSSELSRYFSYDLSLPDTEKLGPYSLHRGCCSVYPFWNKYGLLEIPLTIPQDFYPLYIYNYSPKEMLALWIEKLKYIEKIGGVGVFLLHPDPYLSGNKEMFGIYEELLTYVTSRNCWITTPVDYFNFISRLGGNLADTGADI